MLRGRFRNTANKSKMVDGCHLEKSKYHHVMLFDGWLVGLFVCINIWRLAYFQYSTPTEARPTF